MDIEKNRRQKAQTFHIEKDAEGSKQHHMHQPCATNTENHSNVGELIKSVVLGGLDGIITTFAIVCAVAGSGELGSKVVIMMGVANLVADAISMGLGDYLSEKAEMEYVAQEQAREQWEMDNFIEGEISEMADIYVQKGFTRPNALDILNRMVLNRQFFLEHMMVQEIGVMPVDENAQPALKGAVTFTSFICCGSVPLLVYIGLYDSIEKDVVFSIASGAVSLTLFSLGCLKAKLIQQDPVAIVKSGVVMFLNGAFACSTSYLLGWSLESLLDVEACGS